MTRQTNPNFPADAAGEFRGTDRVVMRLNRADQPSCDWFMQFTGALAENPATYGVTEERARELRGLAEAYAKRLAAARDRQNRTSQDIAAKDEAKQAAMDAIVPLATFIKADFRIPTEAKIALGMRRA